MRTTPYWLMVLTCAMVATGGRLAFGSLVSASPLVTVSTGPADLTMGSLEDDTHALFYQEQEHVVLAAPLHVDLLTPFSWAPVGLQALPPSALGGDIPAGTMVDSHFVHFDSVDQTPARVSGTITFSGRVLGLLVTPPSLNNTDAMFGMSGITYAGLQLYRGVEFEDEVGITMIDPYTLNFALYSGPWMDEFRVITMPIVPEPSSLLLLAGGIVVLARRHRSV